MRIGTTLRNHYTIKAVLGSGGFGNTYLAVDTDLPGSPQCVVKHLSPKDTTPGVFPVAKSLFEREAEYLYKLGKSHTQIPELFAYFEEGGGFYLVEEFVDGHDLTVEIPAGRRMPENKVINLLIEILDVLTFVHQNNVIHRDIKLQNLMRRKRDGKVVLIDFGAVKDVSVLGVDSQGQTSLTASIGSPGYMPSEQTKGKPRLSSDVYAVGIIGIQALTGLHPDQLPEDPNTGEIVWRNLTQISDALADVLQTMVRYHFNQRYQSAVEALHALKGIAPSSKHNEPTVVSASPDVAYISPSRPVTPISPAPDTILPGHSSPLNPTNPPPNSQQNNTPLEPQPLYSQNPQFSNSQPSQSIPSNFLVLMKYLIGGGVVIIIGLIVFIVTVVSNTKSLPTPTQPATSKLDTLISDALASGNAKYDSGDYQGAIADYNEAIRLKPDYAIAFNGRGNAKYDSGDKQGAIADYNEAIRLKPDYAIAFAKRGDVKYDSDDKQGAIADYNETIRLKPDYAYAYKGRGNVKYDLGDKQGALADYNEAIRLKPDYAIAFAKRGDVKYDLGDKQGALADYNEAVRLQPNFPYTYSRRGNLKADLGDKQGAIADYNEAIRLRPGYAMAYVDRGDVKYNLGDKQGALADYNEAIRFKSDYYYSYSRRGNLKADLGDKQGSLADYNEAIRLKSNSPFTYKGRGSVKYDLGDKQGAIADYNEAIRLKPDYAYAYAERGLVKYQLGDKQGAITDLQKAAELFKQQGDIEKYNSVMKAINQLQ